MSQTYADKIADRVERRMRGDDVVEKRWTVPIMKSASRDEIVMDPLPAESFDAFRRRIERAGGEVRGTAASYEVCFRGSAPEATKPSRPDLAVSGVRKAGMPAVTVDSAGRPVPPSPRSAPTDVRAANVAEARAALGHADAQITAAARELQLREGRLSIAEATVRAMAETPALYEAYRVAKQRLDFLLSNSPIIRS